MDVSLIKNVIGEVFFSSTQRVITTIAMFILLLSIPVTFVLVSQQVDIRQLAASPFGSPSTGTPSCSWKKTGVTPGDRVELTVINYSNNVPGIGGTFAPYIEPAGYKTIGKSSDGNIIYELDTPQTTYTATLLDPINPVQNGKVNAMATCSTTTTESSSATQQITNTQNTEVNSPSLCSWSPLRVAPGESADLTYSGKPFDKFTILPGTTGLTSISHSGNTYTYQVSLASTTWFAEFTDINGQILATCALSSGDISSHNPTAVPTSQVAAIPTSSIPTPVASIETYNAVVACIQHSSICDNRVKQSLDYSGDGQIDARDLNILLRAFTSKH